MLKNYELLNEMGLKNFNLGKFEEARECYLTALEIVEENFDNNSVELVIAYNHLGWLYNRIGEYETARNYFNDAFRILNSGLIVGEHKVNQLARANTYLGLGTIYMDIDKNYERAEEMFMIALDIRTDLLGEDHKEVAIVYNNLGNLYLCECKMRLSLRNYLKAKDIFEQVLGENDLCTAMLYNNLGNLYSILEVYEDAIEFYQKSLSVFNSIAPEHGDIEIIGRNLEEVKSKVA